MSQIVLVVIVRAIYEIESWLGRTTKGRRAARGNGCTEACKSGPIRVSGRAMPVQIFPRGIHARAAWLVSCNPGHTASGALFLHGGARDR
jgi:hypothetical protein